jgi:serine/threonine-protein kinase
MSFELGKTYCGYEFLDVLKRSKTGSAYKVLNTFEQRPEVLQVLPRGAQDDPDDVARRLREMQAHARLVHPNILMFYSAMEIEKQAVMTTEFAEGITLAERLQSGPAPVPEAIGLVCQALAALSYAHGQNIVHQDITPENMLVASGGVLKLSPFSLARLATSPELAQGGAVLGDLKYLSPEQVKGKANLDGRSDLYSLGAVFYELLAGRPPFESKSQFDLMLAQVSEAPKAPSAWNRTIPKALDIVVLKLLAKQPPDRYQTANELLEVLEGIEATPEEAAKPAADPEAPPPPKPAAPPLAVEPRKPELPAEEAVGNPPPAIAAAPPREDTPVPGTPRSAESAAEDSQEEASTFATKPLLVIGAATLAFAVLLLIFYLVTK